MPISYAVLVVGQVHNVLIKDACASVNVWETSSLCFKMYRYLQDNNVTRIEYRDMVKKEQYHPGKVLLQLLYQVYYSSKTIKEFCDRYMYVRQHLCSPGAPFIALCHITKVLNKIHGM